MANVGGELENLVRTYGTKKKEEDEELQQNEGKTKAKENEKDKEIEKSGNPSKFYLPYTNP